jgi:hypothetical protein
VVALGEIGVFHKGISCFRNQPASTTVVRRPTLTPNTHTPRYHIHRNLEKYSFLKIPKRGGGERVVALGEIGVFHKGMSCFRNQAASPTVVCRPKLTPNPHLSHHHIPYKLGDQISRSACVAPRACKPGSLNSPNPTRFHWWWWRGATLRTEVVMQV